MDRRGFLRSIGLGIGGIALEQAIPLGRVWSFPKKIVVPVRLDSRIDELLLRYWLPHTKRMLEQDVILYDAFRRGGMRVRSVDTANRIVTLDSIPA